MPTAQAAACANRAVRAHRTFLLIPPWRSRGLEDCQIYLWSCSLIQYNTGFSEQPKKKGNGEESNLCSGVRGCGLGLCPRALGQTFQPAGQNRPRPCVWCHQSQGNIHAQLFSSIVGTCRAFGGSSGQSRLANAHSSCCIANKHSACDIKYARVHRQHPKV